MQITELSANIDQKLTELEQQLETLQENHAQAQSAAQEEKLAADIAALGKIKLKLLKSKDIAWRAHQLQREQDTNRIDDQKRLLGLILCIASGIAAILLLGVYLWSGIF